MNANRRMTLFLSVLMLLLGFAGGSFFTTRQLEATDQASPPPESPDGLYDTTTPAPPEQDVPGRDIHDLPRYPGSVRTEYRRETIDQLVDTEVEYLVSAELETVHNFYRTAFNREGWSVADVGVHMGEWTFFVVSGEREALVELEIEYGLVEIEIEITEPAPSG